MSDLATVDPLTPEQLEANAEFIEAEFGKHGRKGKSSRTPASQKALVYALHDVGKLSQAAIAQRLGMSRLTVSAVLEHRDASALIARNLMGSNSLQLASDWMVASRKGAQRGRHEPARDALYALGVVSPPQQAQQHQQVTVVLSGGEMPTELKIGVLQRGWRGLIPPSNFLLLTFQSSVGS
jgi:DNA-binding Lrp family transcriptional regulator